MNLSDSNCYIGNDGLPSGQFVGYMSNVRVTKGAAIYTAAFTPTMRPFGTLTNNLLTFSENLSNSTWTTQGVSFTPSAAIAPDGTPSATLLIPSTSSEGQNIAGLHDSAAGVNTFSIYAKSAGYRYMQCFHSRSAGGDAGYVNFDDTLGNEGSILKNTSLRVLLHKGTRMTVCLCVPNDSQTAEPINCTYKFFQQIYL